jgi:hypothetical protein
MNTTEIERLIAIKKKSDSSKKIKNSFHEEWLQLARSQGLNFDVLKYLYEGFSFTGALPLVTYFQENETAIPNLEYFFTNSDYVDRNKSITSKLLLHMLALLLKNHSDKHETIKFTMKELPLYCDEKGKLTDNKVFRKYFIQELSENVIFPEIDISDIRTGFRSFHIRIIKNLEITGKEKDTTENEKSIIDSITKWLSSFDLEGEIPINTIGNKLDIIEHTSDTNKKEQMKKYLTAKEYITSLITDVTDLGKIINNILADNEDYESVNIKLNNLLKEKERLCLEENEKKQEITSELFEANDKIKQLSDEIENLRNQIVSKRAEIKNKEKLSDILLRQKDEEKELIVNKISGDLKIEYKDFMSAVDCPMTLDLGENMREQIKSIFSVLKKHNIRVE